MLPAMLINTLLQKAHFEFSYHIPALELADGKEKLALF